MSLKPARKKKMADFFFLYFLQIYIMIRHWSQHIESHYTYISEQPEETYAWNVRIQTLLELPTPMYLLRGLYDQGVWTSRVV